MASCKNRQKAWLGAVIGAGASLLGNIFGGASSAKTAKRQQEEMQREQNTRDTFQLAENMTQAYSNQDYINNLNNRVSYGKLGLKKTLACGGKTKLACGGKRKADFGTELSAAIPGISSGIGAIMNAGFNNKISRYNKINTQPIAAPKPKDALVIPDNTEFIDRSQILRCGGRKKRKC